MDRFRELSAISGPLRVALWCADFRIQRQLPLRSDPRLRGSPYGVGACGTSACSELQEQVHPWHEVRIERLATLPRSAPGSSAGGLAKAAKGSTLSYKNSSRTNIAPSNIITIKTVVTTSSFSSSYSSSPTVSSSALCNTYAWALLAAFEQESLLPEWVLPITLQRVSTSELWPQSNNA